MTEADELRDLSDALREIHAQATRAEIEDPLNALSKAAHEVGEAWSGSWFGYHARVYYADLRPPPPGAHFDMQWGLMGRFQGSTGDWREYDFDAVRDVIHHMAGKPDLDAIKSDLGESAKVIETKRDEAISIIESLHGANRDSFVDRQLEAIREAKVYTPQDYLEAKRPSGKFSSHDTTALSQGLRVPPHEAVLAEVFHARSIQKNAETLIVELNKLASHLDRLSRKTRAAERIGTNVFIGHGRSVVWRDLKDFIQDRLRLPWDEFNRVPVAGVTNIARLSEMLDSAAIALIVLTSEDEQKDGTMHARMNVIHEAGLFQGRLGFTKAILLLEEGCEEFSNVQGLGQIRFPAGNIKAAFEEIRRVLEREGLLEDSGT